MRAHAGLVHGMTCVKNPAMIKTPDKMPPPPPTERGSRRCRPSGRRISHTAETIIAQPLTVQSKPRVASTELTAGHSRNTSTPAVVVAKPRTRNAVPISRSTSTLAAIRTSLVAESFVPARRLLSHSNASTHRTVLKLRRRSCASKKACEVVNHQQRPCQRDCFVYEADVRSKPGNQRPDREQDSKYSRYIAARTRRARRFAMPIDHATDVSPLKSNRQQQNCQTPGGHISM